MPSSSAILLIFLATSASASFLRLDSPGVYSRLTVRIDPSVPRRQCRRAIHNVQVRINGHFDRCFFFFLGNLKQQLQIRAKKRKIEVINDSP